jgi:ribA/ribD-fused uncharacterized protein
MPSTITRFDGEYAFLSNFFEHTILPGVGPTDPFVGPWPTAEHLFQAFKCKYRDDIEPIRDATTPKIAKRLGRRVELRPDWEDIKVNVMRSVLFHKFHGRGSDILSDWLKATYPKELIEGNNWGDRFWGQVRGQGTNMLGELLMERRAVLLNHRKYMPGSLNWGEGAYKYPI